MEQDILFNGNEPTEQVAYTEDYIRHLDDMEHIRTRPGLYI